MSNILQETEEIIETFYHQENTYFQFITSNINNYTYSFISKSDDIENIELSSNINSYIINSTNLDITRSHILMITTFAKDNIPIENRNQSIEDIIDSLLDELNIEDIDSGKDKKTKKDNLEFIFTSTDNQKNNEEKNNITMNLGQCENKLKSEYGISQNDSLYILQIISEEEGMKIPKIEYEIYYRFNNSNSLTKLNLTACDGIKIEISIAVEINDTLDKYDPNSEYYNDICSRATSDSGTDINLQDRKNEFIDNNMSLCEENCKFINYNYTTKKAKCSCDIKLELPEINNIKFNKNEFLKSFTDIKNIINLNIMKCYKTILKMKIKDFRNNYGFMIISFILLFYFFTLIIFCCCSFTKLRKEIKRIIFALKCSYFPKIKYQNNNINNSTNNNKIQIKKEINKKKYKSKKFKLKNKSNLGNYLNTSKKQLNSKNQLKGKKQNFESLMTQRNREIFEAKKKFKEFMKEKAITTKFNDKALRLKDFEINSLDYEDALSIDKRGCFEYYFSLLKNNHPLTFSFCSFNDYNSFIIKMFLFFYSFGLDFTVNTLFFNDETMHKIYEDKGEFNILYQIPQILLSTVISKIIDSIIRTLALSQDSIVQLKNLKEKNSLDIKFKTLIRALKIKFTFFFIISFCVLSFFLYYETCFCGIYVNTQIHLIKDSALSFGVGLLYPFGMFLIPAIFRIAALRMKKPTGKFIYKFSSFIENYFC